MHRSSNLGSAGQVNCCGMFLNKQTFGGNNAVSYPFPAQSHLCMRRLGCGRRQLLTKSTVHEMLLSQSVCSK